MTGPARLATALRAHAHGQHGNEAAVDLLINHATWLRRADFPRYIVHISPGQAHQAPMATISWTEAIAALDQGELPCSGSEGRILRLAASLAVGIPIDLRDALTSLDSHNTELVTQAISHATGH